MIVRRGLVPLAAALLLASSGGGLPALAATAPSMSTAGTAGAGAAGPAQAGDLSQQAAIEAARQMLSIDPQLTNVSASYSMVQNQQPMWSLYFTLPQADQIPGQPTPSVSVQLDAKDGTLLSYQSSPGSSAAQGAVALKVTQTQAIAAAQAFIQKVAPPHLSELHLRSQVDTNGYGGDISYTVYLDRLVDGLPVIDGGQTEGVAATVSAKTGEVTSYTYTWTPNLNFGTAVPAVTRNQALAAYRKRFGFQLAYQQVTDPLKQKSAQMLGYGPALYPNFAVIDGATGAFLDGQGQPLTDQKVTPDPVQGKALLGLSLPLTEQGAEARARALLGLSSKATVRSVSLSGGDWSIGLDQPLSGKDVEHAYVTVSSASGAVSTANMYIEQPGPSSPPKPQYAPQSLAAKAAAFMQLALGTQASDWTPQPQWNQTNPGQQTSVTFSYSYQVNGYPVTSDTARVTMSTVTGQIENFSASPPPQGTSFPTVANPQSADAAFAAWSKDAGLRLVWWVHQQRPGKGPLIPPVPQGGPAEVTLGWQVPSWASGDFVDPTTLRLIDGQGHDALALRTTPVDLQGPGSQALEILVSEHLFAPDATGHIYPQRVVTRGEALQLLLNIRGVRPFSPKAAADTLGAVASSAAGSYAGDVAAAVSAGILPQNVGSFQPDEPVTRAYFSLLAARTLGFAPIADMSLQIPIHAQDASQVPAADANAMALMIGLGVLPVENGDAMPSETLTRVAIAQALVRLMTLNAQG